MKKVIIIIVSVILIIMFTVLTNAVVLPIVDSSMTEPVTQYYVDGDYLYVTLYVVIDRNDYGYPVLIKQDITTSKLSNIIFRLDDNQFVGFYSDQEIYSNKIINYNALNGNFILESDMEIESVQYQYNGVDYSYYAKLRPGYFPKRNAYDDNVKGFYCILPSYVPKTEITSLYSNAFINWRYFMNIVEFVSNLMGIPDRYSFIIYIISGAIILILLDGLITFLFSGFSSLTSKK